MMERPLQKSGQKIIVVLPAFNAESTLEKTLRDIPLSVIDEVILVDDASQDRTVELSKQLGILTFCHPKNLGYGGNQKTCYTEALQRGADIVIMVHPDYQYDPQQIPQLIAPLLEKECDAVLGSRMLGGQFFQGGMPKWKFIGNILLTAIENIVMKVFYTEYHSGFRAYTRRYLTTVNFMANSNDFVFDTEIIAQGVFHGLRIGEIPISTRYFEEASQIGFIKSLRYAFSIFGVLVKFHLKRKGLGNFTIFQANRNSFIPPLSKEDVDNA